MMPPPRGPTFVLLALAMSLWLTGCDRAEPSAAAPLAAAKPASEPAQAATPSTGDRLVVFAATSLKDAFATLSDEFERAHQGVEVVFYFAGTQELRTQLEQGALADVFAS